MLLLPAPAQRSHAEKDALIAGLTARLLLADERIAAQDARIAALEARLSHQTRPPKTPAIHRGRPRKDTSQTSRHLVQVARRAKAAPVSGGRYIRTRIIRLTAGWSPARSVRRYFPTRRKPHSRSTSASSCHPSVRM